MGWTWRVYHRGNRSDKHKVTVVWRSGNQTDPSETEGCCSHQKAEKRQMMSLFFTSHRWICVFKWRLPVQYIGMGRHMWGRTKRGSDARSAGCISATEASVPRVRQGATVLRFVCQQKTLSGTLETRLSEWVRTVRSVRVKACLVCETDEWRTWETTPKTLALWMDYHFYWPLFYLSVHMTPWPTRLTEQTWELL